MRHAWVLVSACLLGSRVSQAQCPDGTPPPCRSTRATANGVAVLYFDLLSRDSADTYLADGLTEELIVRLGQVPRLLVKSRSEVQRFRGRPLMDVGAVARALNAAYLVTGSLRKSGSRVVVTAELMRMTPRPQRVWGDVFDRSSSDVLDIESSIATAVAGAVAGQLYPAEREAVARRPTRDPEAYQLYQHGRALFRRGSDLRSDYPERDLRAAIAFYDAALERDSTFAAAWAGKAEVWGQLADFYVPAADAYDHARYAALRAIALDSTLATAHAFLGFAIATLDHDWAAAEAHARRATLLDPRAAEGWAYLSWILGPQGRLDDAYAAAQQAWEADSLSTSTQVAMRFALSARRHTAEQRTWSDRFAAAGLNGMATQILIDGQALSPDSVLRLMPGVVIYLARAGRLAAARDSVRVMRQSIDSLTQVGVISYVMPDAMAWQYAAIGELDEAFRWIERAIAWKTGAAVLWLKVDPRFDSLRGDPRYVEMLRRLNLSP